MFAELVKASNNAAVLSFVSNARRLIMLITHEFLGHFIGANERGTLTLG